MSSIDDAQIDQRDRQAGLDAQVDGLVVRALEQSRS